MRIKPIPALLLGLMASGAVQAASPIGGFQFEWTASHTAGVTSEVPAFDALTNTLWVAGVVGVDVLNAGTGSLVQHIDTTGFGFINSVAIHNGMAAMAFESSADRTANGQVVLFDTASRALASGTNQISVGALPDMLAFTADGSKLLVANEATPTVYGGFDPAGSVSIIDMGSRSVAATAGFAGVPITGSGVRSPGMDFEPEYITLNAAGTHAFVTLQEANAMGVLDLGTNTFTSVVGLGTKDFSLPGNAIDPSHKDGTIELRAADVKGFYQPDAVAAYEAGGQTYLVMANEGDTREDDGDKARVKDSGLAGSPADLAQLNISTLDSTSGTELYTFGGRSFSIRDTDGNLVFDSGNQLDAEAIARGIYDDGRSDDKGVEPEGVELVEIDGRTFAFIGLERTTKGAVAVYDITDPANASFVDMIVTDGDRAPEGMKAFVMDGKHYLAIANEVSNTTTLYSVNMAPVPEPETYAMLLAGLGLVGFMARRRNAQRA
ncbi:MAG: choice-of-anchor I family protein [Gammaproteobacteria bacterium]|nr:choice-of-anchor I family protein [Gammaproteobacteria bacterium]MBU1407221.1 choice-of-anchor I family protein [Gammaproteobacteria bacterium]MBU1531405.1 choice-of-anchor I family protein [Gammaproteobacteria bacterium]